MTGKDIENATFEELHALKEEGFPFKDIYFVGYNFSEEIEEIFSYKHYPKMIIADAVRISMSIHFIFEPHNKRYDKIDGERVLHYNENGESPLYWDGGLVLNYPIKILSDDNNDDLIGFRLVSKKLIDKYERGLFKQNIPDEKSISVEISLKDFLLEFIKAYVALTSSNQEREHRSRINDQRRTVYIDDLGIGFERLDITPEEKLKLIESGEEGAFSKKESCIEVGSLHFRM